VGIVVENISQRIKIQRVSDSELLGSALDDVRTGVSPYNGLANSTRPLPIARNQLDTITSDAPSRAESRCSAALYAPQYAPHPTESTQRAENWEPHLISCPVVELRAHPSFVRHRLSVDASKLSALAERGDLAFLQQHPRVQLHFTPTYSSWLNQVEIWFAKIEREVIARGIFTSVPDLARKLRRYINAYSANARPIQWKYSDASRRLRTNEFTATAH
jgi:hypothetical protein